MVAVPNIDGAARFIPSDRAETLIDMDWLTKHAACQPGKKWFAETFPNGCKYVELRAKLAEEKRDNWETWILVEIGGDTATAGDSGTATAGYSGTATAGYRGTATAGLEGFIRILEWDAKQERYRVVFGVVDGVEIEANTPYVAVDGKLAKKPVEA